MVLTALSVAFYAVWLGYNWHIEPYVKMSIARMQRIEKELMLAYEFVSPLADRELELFKWHEKDPKKYPRLVKSIPRLHAIIQEVAPEGRGRMILWILTLLLIVAWTLRVALFFFPKCTLL